MIDMSEDLVKNSYNIQDIIKILPHRYPFVLIDRIDEVKQGEYVNAIKNITINEPFFQGHFPLFLLLLLMRHFLMNLLHGQ